MSQEESLRQAVLAIRAGRKSEARQLLVRMLEANPQHEDAWLWMSAVVDTDEQRIDCLRRVLAINPDNAPARESLALLQGESLAPGVTFAPGAREAPLCCPTCGCDNPPSATVCYHCGERLDLQLAADLTAGSEGVARKRGVSRAAIAILAFAAVVVCSFVAWRWVVPRALRPSLVAPVAGPDSFVSLAELQFRVLDAEYSLALDRIVMVSDSPAQLHIFDPETHTDTTVDLSYSPTSVSVGPDGRFAAVGHDGRISYIDLEAGRLVKVLDVLTDVYDLVLAGNGWIYASPGRGQWVRLHAVHIETNHEVQNSGREIYAGSVYRLHPDGQRLYGINQGRTTAGGEIIDISDVAPVLLRPDSGASPECGNLWLSEDGQRVFDACGNVLRVPSSLEQNMTYAGSLQRLEYVQHLVHSSSAGLALAIRARRYWRDEDRGAVENQLFIYEYENLNLEGIVTLPDFGQWRLRCTANGRFVFINAAGTRYYVIVKTDSPLGLLDRFGLVTGDLSAEALASLRSALIRSEQAAVVPIQSSEGPFAALDFRVVDAEYSLSLDRIVIVSDEPAQLHVYDPATQTDTAVDLPRPPTCVSVGPDGRFAAVGHDALLSYIDLESVQVVKTLDLRTDVADVVLGGNGWIYASPLSGESGFLHAVRVDTNQEVLSTGERIHERSLYKLHPDGQSLYGVTRGVSPSDIEKLDISDGVPAYAYDSPYRHDYPMCADLWLSEDGLRIFTACGNVFHTSSDREQDMRYDGSLSGLGLIEHLVHSSSAEVVLALRARHWDEEDPDPVENQLRFFEYENLTPQRVVTLPDLVVNGQTWTAHGRFVFVNAAGTEYYVIVQVDPNSGSPERFGLVLGDVSAEATDVVSGEPSPTPEGPITHLDFAVLDAEYSPSLERIVMVSDDPAQLHVYDAATDTDTTVDLSRSPTSVSVGPDGTFAAVGHDRQITYVDLKNARVVKMLDVRTDVCDIVLADNGWVYASPRRDQWETLRAVNIETNREVESTGSSIYAGSVYKLHPDGQSLYGADPRVSPSDIEKLDISDGVPSYAYDSPYHGDYAMGGDLWLSEDGQRIFTAGGNVFRASSNPEEDMTYVGTLPNLSGIGHLVHSGSAGLVLAIPGLLVGYVDQGVVENQVVIFAYENFDLERTVTLPDFVVNGLPYAANGRFVFANAAGTQYHVIVQAEEGSGLLHDFGIITGEL